MHFGIFVEEMRYGASQVSAFRDAFDLAQRAEDWGLDCVWLGEIHFTPNRSVISASLQVASSIATRTRRLRVGTAVTVLPLNHPLRIAEEIATLDHISEGRLEFGIGRSGVARSYDSYGIAYGESQARFREALDIIREAWKGEPFSYEGEFYRFQNTTVAPRPGIIVTLRCTTCSGAGSSASRTVRRATASSTTRCSAMASAAPRQRRMPPPNGIHV